MPFFKGVALCAELRALVSIFSSSNRLLKSVHLGTLVMQIFDVSSEL